MNILVKSKQSITTELLEFTKNLINLNYKVFWNLTDQKIDFELVSTAIQNSSSNNIQSMVSEDIKNSKHLQPSNNTNPDLNSKTQVTESKTTPNSTLGSKTTITQASNSQSLNFANSSKSVFVNINDLFKPADYNLFEPLKVQPKDFGFAQFIPSK